MTTAMKTATKILLVATSLVVLAAGPALAQDEDPGEVYVEPTVVPDPNVQPLDAGVAASGAVAGDPQVLGGAEVRGSTLPLTGGDVVAIAFVGFGAVAIGATLLVLRRRRGTTPDLV